MSELEVIAGGRRATDRRTRAVFLWSMGVGLVFTGLTFALKVAEFIFTMSSEDAAGFADVPVTVYFCVAAGWFFFLIYCWVTGKFRNVEHAKFDLLELEEEYERQGI